MDRETLLRLIKSWRAGDCPNEILMDAMMDMNIDLSKQWGPNYFSQPYRDTLRKHILDCGGKYTPNEREIRQFNRETCTAVIAVEEWLKGVNDGPQQTPCSD